MAKPTVIVDDGDATRVERPAREHPLSKGRGAAEWIDDRTGAAGLIKANLRKVFPDHWSFLLGEIALFSFIILLITGVFLTIWFKPSMSDVEYEGTYQMLRGVQMSEAYASTIGLSFDVRGGLLVRQIHHWAAMLFIAAAVVHMLRIFFTGAFRKPRELNWLIGTGLFSIAMVEGFAGYSLPDDLLSGTGLRFADGMMRSVPLIGTWAEFFVFGGEFPGSVLIPRLYMVHILLVPGLLLALIGAHLALIVYHKHTQYPGPGRTEENVVGYPMFPVYAAKAGGFFFIVFGVVALMGAFMQINPVWMFGPYNPAQVTAGSQPDWYMGVAEGAVRIMPNWEWHIGGTTWSWNVFIPGALTLAVLFTSIGAYPFVERWFTGDNRPHHLLDRPRNVPTRTALGVAAMTAYAVLWIGGGNDIIATQFHTSLNAITYTLRVLFFVAPVLAFIITRRLCIALQRSDRERALHGSESGVIDRSLDGGYSEAHEAVSEDETYKLAGHAPLQPLEATATTDADGVALHKVKVSPFRARMSRWFTAGSIEPPTVSEIEAGHHHDGAELTPAGEAEREAIEAENAAHADTRAGGLTRVN